MSKYFAFIGCLLSFFSINGQSLFDDSQVNSIYIEIPIDSLSQLYTDIYSTHSFPVRFIYKDGAGSDTIENVGFRLRGNTSRSAKKKSFKVSFNEFVVGQSYQGEKTINLNGEHNDPTMIREKLFYDTWAKIGLPKRKTAFVKVYINQVYYGLYTNLEELDKNWLTASYSNNTGNLYKCTYPADMVYSGTNQQTYKNIQSGTATGGRAYELQTNEIVDDYTDLVQLITLFNSSPNATFATQIQQIFNVDCFLRALALDVASGNWDDYAYNKNNYFLYRNMTTNQFEFITYDTDNTFGVDWIGKDWATRDVNNWLPSGQARPMAEKLLAIPSFKQQYLAYVHEFVNGPLHPDSIFSHIDALHTLITPAAIADNYRTLDYGYTVADFHLGFTGTVDGHCPYGIKPFLTKRRQTINQQVGIPLARKWTFNIFPNPAKEEIKIEFSQAINKTWDAVLLDTNGVTVCSKHFVEKDNLFRFALPTLSKGIYFLKVQVGEHSATQKVMIE